MPNKNIFSFEHNLYFWMVVHRLIQDTITLALIAFAGLMTLDSVMPGFVSSHLNLAKVLFFIAILFFASFATGFAKPEENPSEPKRQWITNSLVLWSSLLIINSLIKFPLYAIVIIFVTTLIIIKLFHQEFLEEND